MSSEKIKETSPVVVEKKAKSTKKVSDVAVETKKAAAPKKVAASAAKKKEVAIEVKDLGASVAKKAADSVSVIKKTKSKSSSDERVYATGRRKEAVARVWLSRGTGEIQVNGKELTTYFARPTLRMIINQPFAQTNTIGKYDVVCTISGSGHSGQAGALRHGISRALDAADPALHELLRHNGFLTRDSRAVERKKYGRKKARKSFQFCKR